jgi:hypothetical protein
VMPITLSISGNAPIEIDAETISIGSEPASTVVIRGDGRIKAHHALIRKVAGRWLVEAREADFIQVGSAAPARVNWLNPGDVIRLAENGPEITFQPSATVSPPPSAPVSHSPPAPVLQSPRAPVSPRPPVPVFQSPPRPVSQPAFPPLQPVPVPVTIDPIELPQLHASPVGESPRVKALPTAAEWEPPVAPDCGPSPDRATGPRRKTAGLLIGNGISVALFAIGYWIWFGKGADNSRPAPAVRPAASTSATFPKKKTRPVKDMDESPPSAMAAASHDPEDEPPSPSAGPSQDHVNRCLYAVLVRDSASKRYFRLGTAWAAAPGYLVTSGAVVMAIEELQQAGLSAIVSPAEGKQEIRVVAMRVHPVYRQAAADVAAARKLAPEASEAPGAVEEQKPNEPQDDQIQSAHEKLAHAYSSQATFDLGILQPAERLADVLTRASARLEGPPEGQFVLSGFPFKIDDYRTMAVSTPARPDQCAGNPASGIPGGNDDLRLMLEFSGDLRNHNWSGSPVFNHAGEVVGVYSRLVTRSAADGAGPPAHAVARIARLLEFAADLK